jgi:prepilin-type N-terminal cleavage/methylation domain-containing protein
MMPRIPPPHRRATGFTLLELLVVVTIISVLIAVLVPAVKAVREAALGIRCAANLRQISTATVAYAGDNRGMVVLSMNPAGQYWFQVLSSYTEDQNKVASATLGQIIRGCPKYRYTSMYKSAVAKDNWWTVKDMCGYSETFFLRGDAPYDAVNKGYTAGCTWFKYPSNSGPGGFTTNNRLAGVSKVATRPLF